MHGESLSQVPGREHDGACVVHLGERAQGGGDHLQLEETVMSEIEGEWEMFRKVSDTLWDSEKLNELGEDNDAARLLYVHLLVNRHGNSAGCYTIRVPYVMEELRWSGAGKFKKAMMDLIGVGLIAYTRSTSTVLIENWLAFNPPTNAKHGIRTLTDLKQASSEELRTRRGQEIAAYCRAKGYHNDRISGAKLLELMKPYEPDSLSNESDSLSIAYAIAYEGPADSLSIASGTLLTSSSLHSSEPSGVVEGSGEEERSEPSPVARSHGAALPAPRQQRHPRKPPPADDPDNPVNQIPEHLRTPLIMGLNRRRTP